MDGMATDYEDFLRQKIALDQGGGFEVEDSRIHPILKPHQRDIVRWAVAGGRRAVFAAFGLGKTIMALEIVRLTLEESGGTRGLIVIPLGVRQEFTRDARMIGLELRFVRSIDDASEPGIYLTNYETIRDGKMDPRLFDVVSLDEASCLRGLGGTKTFRTFMGLFEGTDSHRFVATATPSPNDYTELLAYAAFLGVMDVGQAKTRFFKRDSTKADNLKIHPHKEREFWLWVSSWAIFIQRPSNLGYSNDGYDLPPMDIRWHEVATDHSEAGVEKSGQGRMFQNAALGVQDAAREKRKSLPARMAKLMELRAEDPGAHRILWHDLEAERHAIEKAIPSSVSVYGSQSLEDRERAIIEFSDGKIQELAAKPVIAGSGCNFQRHCSWSIFMGIGFKFNDFIQAIHRIYRFQQTQEVRIDLIYTEAEREVRKVLEAKWEKHKKLVAEMTSIIEEFGLSHASMAASMERSIGCERREMSGRGWKIVNNDSVEETRTMEDSSVGLIVTSVPFSNQYEYTPSYNDFGHSDDNDHFLRQMDFLSPELLRVLQPGRIMAIHCKDRITPGGINGLGFQTVQPFHAELIEHYIKHGFAYLGMKTICTDVVRENNQTYRLGWTEQCKDGSRMGCGMPEYLLIFRRPPSDRSDGYADVPVTKDKDAYSLGKWQIDAHGFQRSSGDRPLSPEDLDGLTHAEMYQLWRKYNTGSEYDFEQHVALCDSLKARRVLPVTFMLLPPHSWHPDIWSDVARMRTLNMTQAAKGKEMHLCPLQFDIVDRCIIQYSMEGEVVYDPFSGIGTVPSRAVRLGRFGLGSELGARYCVDAAWHCASEEKEIASPTLFDLLDEDSEVA